MITILLSLASIFNQSTTAMSDGNDEPTFIHTFHYYQVSSQRQEDNEEMARLNYMTSRICAALFRWSISYTSDVGAEWWWTGLWNEVVCTSKLGGKGLPNMKVGCCDGNCWACCRLHEYFPRHPLVPSGTGSVYGRPGRPANSVLQTNVGRN